MKSRRIIAVLLLICMVFVSGQPIQAASKQKVFDSADMYSDKQTDIWQYMTREVVTNVYKELTYNKDSQNWEDGMGGIISKGFMHATADASDTHETQMVLQFTAPYSGNIDIIDKRGTISVSSDSVNGVKLWVWNNNTPIMEEMIVNVACGYKQKFVPVNTDVKAGDTIRFILSFNGDNAGDGTEISPIIHYVTINNNDNSGNGEENGNNQGIVNEPVTLPPQNAKAGLYNMKDMFSGSMDGVWKYRMRETVTAAITDMKWDGTQWSDGKGGIITDSWIHASSDQSATHENMVCLQFVAPNSGNLTIYSLDGLLSVDALSQNGVRMGILHNSTFLYGYEDLKPGVKQAFKPITVDVIEGDVINFLFSAISDNSNDMTFFVPVIAYNKAQPPLSSLVTLPKKGSEADGVYDFSKAFDAKQGPVWNYMRRETVSGKMEELKYDSKNKQWTDNMGGIISNTWIHASADASANHEWLIAQQFVAPSEGNITIYSANGLVSISPDSGNGVRMGIMQNGNFLLQYTDLKPGEKFVFQPITVNVDAGDTINFLFSAISDNSSDSTEFAPVVVYNAYEKIIENVETEIREDDPAQTVYNSWESYGNYLNPWYYKFWRRGTNTPEDMAWDPINGGWRCEEMTACSFIAEGCHPGVEQRPTRVFKAPKSGYVDISMMDGVIRMLAENALEGDDGVYVSILLYDGNSPVNLTDREYLFPNGGETLYFEDIKDLHIYKGWEIWFVVDCNVNNQNDMVQLTPSITYTKITDEEPVVYLNAEEETRYCDDFMNPDSENSGKGNGLSSAILKKILLNAAGVAAVAVIAGVVYLIVKKRKRK